MFYMYYEARNGDENSPIVLWLQVRAVQAARAVPQHSSP